MRPRSDRRPASSSAVSGEIAIVTSNLPQRELYRLIRWAEERGVELGELTVKRPTLEEVFLEVTGTRVMSDVVRRAPPDPVQPRTR